MECLIFTQHDIRTVAEKLLKHASDASHQTQATVIVMSGNLGAGKTTLVQELAGVMGVVEQVTSPTFVVMKRYETTHPIFTELIHIDAYRIEQQEEMDVLGIGEWMKNPKTLVCIEWPEKISTHIPATAISVSLEVIDEQSRKITYG